MLYGRSLFNLISVLHKQLFNHIYIYIYIYNLCVCVCVCVCAVITSIPCPFTQFCASLVKIARNNSNLLHAGTSSYM